MKKILSIVTLAMVYSLRIYSGFETKPEHNNHSESETTTRQNHESPQHSVTEPQHNHNSDAVTVQDYALTEEMLAEAFRDKLKLNDNDNESNKLVEIHRTIATQGPASIGTDDLAWYLRKIKNTSPTPVTRIPMMKVIEEFSKDPKKIVAFAPEIADAIFWYDYDYQSLKPLENGYEDLSQEQVDMLITSAKIMLENKKYVEGIKIISDMINRRTNGTILTPELWDLVKKVVARERNNKILEGYVRLLLNAAATNIDRKAHNALNILDFAELVDRTRSLRFPESLYQSWYETIDTYVSKITPDMLQAMSPNDKARLALIASSMMDRKPKLAIALIKNLLATGLLQTMKPEEIISFGQITPELIKQAPDVGLMLLSKLMDNRLLTSQNYPQMMAIYKASLPSMLAKGNPSEILSFFTKISQLTGDNRLDQKQKMELNKLKNDLMQTYLSVLQRNGETFVASIIKNQVLKTMTLDELINFAQLTQTLIEQSPDLGLQLLAQLMETSLITPENFDQLIALQKACIDSIRPTTLVVLIKQNKADAILSLLDKIARFENNISFTTKQRVALETYVYDLLDSYIKILNAVPDKKEKEEIAAKIQKSIERLSEQAKDPATLTRALRFVAALRTFIPEKQLQPLLTYLASKAQALREASTTIEQLKSSLNMAGVAYKAGLDKKTYNQWVTDIVDETLELLAKNASEDDEVDLSKIDRLKNTTQLLQSEPIFSILATAEMEDLETYIKKITTVQQNVVKAIETTLLTQPKDSKTINAGKEDIDAAFTAFIRKLQATKNIRITARTMAQQQ